ncbi:MAG: hypothetical protein R3272_09960 [Candidatus Promineifilaceae bacterium]|nr:hypothetical protein [Candidatus Promineifilaceae bacterium]
MPTTLTSEDILADIEFELAQGSISRDDLGRGIVAIKKHQSKLRSELLGTGREDIELRQALAKQFQMNDMLLTLLQETSASIQNLKLQVRRTNELAPRPPAPTSLKEVDEDSSLTDHQWRDRETLRDAVATSLQPEMDIRPTDLPLAGSLLRRLRYAAHMLVLFYVRRLGEKQQEVNRTFGDWFLYQDALHRSYAEENARLRRRIAALEERFANSEGDQE